MKITFFLPGGVIEWPVPPDAQAGFNFNAAAVQFRLNGFFIANDIYLRHDMVVGMCFTADGVEQGPQFRPPGMNLQ